MITKRVLLVSQYFYPENFKGNDIAFDLYDRGYKVDVLTGIPNYPEGKYAKGYGLFLNRIQSVNGVKVYRCFQIPRGKNSKIGLILNYMSFVMSAVLWVLCVFSLKKRYDAIIIQQLSPVTSAIPGILLGKIKKIPVYTWVLDLWPEAMSSAGGVKNQKALDIVEKLVKWVYNGSTKILMSSRRFKESIMLRCEDESKLIYFPNWSVDMFNSGDSYKLPSMLNGFRIMTAGTMGISQNLGTVSKVILALKDTPEVKWIFVGGGSKKKWMEDFIKTNNLESTVQVLGRYPYESMPSFYQSADAMLVSLNEDFIDLRLVVPARLQSYMSAGKPVLAMIGEGGREVVEEANCGYAVNGNDWQGLVDIIKNKVLGDKDGFLKLGSNGREYFLNHFTESKCIDNLCKIINQ